MARKKEAAAVQAINANVLVQLVKSKSDNKVKIGEINGELGGRIRHHKELSGLDPVAYGVICKLDGKSEQDRAAILTNIQLYADMMVEKGRWQKHVGDLAEQAAAAQAASEAPANANQPDEPVPASDEQPDDDPRPESLKRRHEEIEAEQKAATEAVVADNVTKLRRGIKKAKPADAVVH